MNYKSQLQQRITELELKFQKFKSRLNNCSEITLKNSKPGDVLSDGTVVIYKKRNKVLIAAPEITQVKTKWTPEFPEVFESLKSHGFIPSQWHIPKIEELKLAYKNSKKSFSSAYYWSSAELSVTSGCALFFFYGFSDYTHKKHTLCVRAFRWVTV